MFWRIFFKFCLFLALFFCAFAFGGCASFGFSANANSNGVGGGVGVSFPVGRFD